MVVFPSREQMMLIVDDDHEWFSCPDGALFGGACGFLCSRSRRTGQGLSLMFPMHLEVLLGW